MNWRVILRLLGALIALYSLTFVPSVGVSIYYGDGQTKDFLIAALISIVLGAALFLPHRDARGEVRIRDGFLIVALFWIVLGVLGGIPFVVGLHLDYTDAIFEAVSGFTTTGATVITGLDRLPPSVLYHRQQIQWLGGMGVVVLAIAILPMLGVGGMQLYRAEASGITKEDKLTPRIASTARALWAIYLALTVACALAYWIAGMSPFDAITHAYSTVSTAGFSTHDASIAYFDSIAVEWICIVFMLAGGVNFAVHFIAFRARPSAYFTDQETRTYLGLFIVASLFVAAGLLATGYADPGASLRLALFQVASVLTSTGFGIADFSQWPLHLPFTLLILSYIGGCAGSTAGGLKVVRVMLLLKVGLRQLQMMSHSHRVVLVRLGQKRVPDEVIYSVLAYYSLYILTAIALTLGMLAAGLDIESAVGAVTATLNLLGPGLGSVATTFAEVNDVVKWLGVVGMLIGRLEVFTLLILFTPAFWRH